MGGAGNRGLNDVDEFEGQRSSQQVVFLRIERVLDLLPGRSLGTICRMLKTGKGGEAAAGVLDESLAHVLCNLAPAGDEGHGIGFVAGAEFLVDNGGENVAQLRQAPRPGKFGNRVAEFTPGCVAGRRGEKLLFKLSDIDGHARDFLDCKFSGRKISARGGAGF